MTLLEYRKWERFSNAIDNAKKAVPGQKTLVVGSNDLIDAIESVDSNTTGSQKIFNLQGVQLNKAQKGVNIINGRKVMVKWVKWTESR